MKPRLARFQFLAGVGEGGLGISEFRHRLRSCRDDAGGKIPQGRGVLPVPGGPLMPSIPPFFVSLKARLIAAC